MKNKFLEKVAEQIADKHSRKLITAELESHLLDKIDYYVDIGYSKEDAEKRATEEMGNPEDTAVPLNALHNNNFRDLLSFICCGVIILMFFCTIWFRDAFIYSYDNQSYRHSILCDFVSLAFLIAYAVMLILARKNTLNHSVICGDFFYPAIFLRYYLRLQRGCTHINSTAEYVLFLPASNVRNCKNSYRGIWRIFRMYFYCSSCRNRFFLF